jgi:hypothetical protein
MPEYLVLLYAPEVGPDEQAERERELPLWLELNESLEQAGLLGGTNRLHGAESATTVRIRDGDTQITDGPFAVTKEILGGYYVLSCRDLDEALKHAVRIPLARYGSVEVRPIMDFSEMGARAEAASAQA